MSNPAGVIEPLNKNTASGAAATLDLSLGSVQDITLTANCTLTIANTPATGRAYGFSLIVRQDATGSRAITWFAGVKWPGGTVPTGSTLASSVDMYSFYTVDGGVTWYGVQSGKGFA